MIDANSMAKRAKVPICDPNSMFRVSTETGRVFLRGSEEAAAHNATAMHFFGTYASSWFLFEVRPMSIVEEAERFRLF